MATDSTTRRILDAALELFNERGVGVVSTRAIAERAGVSSGNLHYHFAGKQAIVRALLERRDTLTNPVWQFPAPPSLPALEGMLRANLRLAWQYRFLNRELVTITLGDEEFQHYYAAMYRRRIDQLRALLRRFVELGLIDLTPPELDTALTTGWIVSENWLGHLETIGLHVMEDSIADGARRVIRLLDPAYQLGSTSV